MSKRAIELQFQGEYVGTQDIHGLQCDWYVTDLQEPLTPEEKQRHANYFKAMNKIADNFQYSGLLTNPNP